MVRELYSSKAVRKKNLWIRSLSNYDFSKKSSLGDSDTQQEFKTTTLGGPN